MGLPRPFGPRNDVGNGHTDMAMTWEKVIQTWQ